MGVVEQVSVLPSVVKDAPDLRDQVYLPSLRPLPSELPIDESLVRALRSGDPLNWLPRDQGEEGTCAAQAAATLIDLQRVQTARASFIAPQVSARMLYQMAIQQNYERQTDGVCLRDVIKGFYHNGVCSEGLWRYRSCDTKPSRLTIKRAKDARKISLGAYYRLRPSLNDYHAALNDVGAILVSSGIHEGWSKHLVARRDGHINPRYPQSSAHAFVIVGYDSKGFLVLNSWGKRWGGFLGCPGVAHWRYDDWADNIFDGWVLRLGVSTPAAFPYAIGEQGIYLPGKPAAAASTPAFQVRGHLIHLDDGSPVIRSRYPYDDRTIAETCRYLTIVGQRTKRAKTPAEPSQSGAKYNGVALKLSGSLLGLDDIVREINHEKEAFKRKHLYPLTVAWCNDFVEKTSSILSQLALGATKQIDTRSSGLDALIESHIRGVGRAFWRDIERASAKSTAVDGPLSWAVTNLLRLEGFSLHILSDGAGAILLCDLIEMLESVRNEDFVRLAQMIRTVDLIAPTVTADRLGKLLRSVGITAKVTLHVPSRETEARLSVGMYSKSLLQLIENAFCSSGLEDRPNFVGKSLACSGIQSVVRNDFPALCINEISVDAPYGQFLTQNDLYSQSNLLPRILERISPVESTVKARGVGK
ncbi:C1 family peptidase [Rhizobium laguerreae]|uniref:C1 family peptidase n=1 Tax=Rhizobium laguerreae TaxID=1076926 RepID=UPI001C91AEE3|nr:C1 family peptidase [Rhizobium laguerreae]MBY3447023.1 C1 family peptidase [Rhizobium laguerreae]